MKNLKGLFLVISFILSLTSAENIIYPASFSRVFNVKTEFGAKGDGITDDTKAIEAGLKKVNTTYQMLYFPNGTYLVSTMLKVAPWTIIQGQSTAGTILKLKNSTIGFTTKSAPQAMMRTWVEEPAGGMNMQFNVYINNLTLNTGSGNAGAIGIKFIANNGGGLDHISVVSDDNDGYCGMDFTSDWDGPEYSHHLTVTGFDYGLCVGSMHYSTTLEYVTISNQKIAGIKHLNHPTTIRKLISTNTVPAIINDNTFDNGDNPLLVLLDSELKGGAAENCAIKQGKGSLFVRNVATTGYKAVIDSQGTVKVGTSIGEYSSMTVHTLFGGIKKSLNMPIKETIDFPWDPLDSCVNIDDYASKKVGDDWGPAIQAAIASGKSTIFFPAGDYSIHSTVILNGNVRSLRGIGSRLDAGPQISRTNPMFRISTGTSTAVLFDLFSFEGDGKDIIHIESASNRTCVVKHSRWLHYQNQLGAGDLFVDDAAGSTYYFDFPQKVFLRALNLESNSTSIFNKAADLVVLNHKTEGQGTSIITEAKGRTEILGGLNYPAGGNGDLNPAYLNQGGQMTVIQLQWYAQTTTIAETRLAQTKKVLNDDDAYLFYTANYDTLSNKIRNVVDKKKNNTLDFTLLKLDTEKGVMNIDYQKGGKMDRYEVKGRKLF